jgi:hypothetical protein
MANPRPSPATRFRQGQSGNPGGKPKDPFLRALRTRLTDEDAATMLDVLIAMAKSGNLKAIEMLWDRLEGRVVARQEAGDPGAFTGLEDVPTDELIRRIEEYRKLR